MKSPKNTRAALTLATATLAMSLLVGCATGSTPDDSRTPAPTTSASSAPEPETLEVPAGAPIAPEDVEKLPKGQYAYEMPDASKIVVTSTEPLPEPVRAYVQEQIDASLTEVGTTGQTSRDVIYETAQSLASKVGIQTGKRIVIIYPLFGSCPGDPDGYLGWAHTNVTYSDGFDCLVLPTRADAEAQVASAIAAQATQETYQVFVRE